MIKKCKVILVLGLIAKISFSQSVPALYEVATWSGFRTAAISYTFDDGCTNQFKIAIPLFDIYGFKLTLFSVTSRIKDWSALKSAAANGHEVASHTVTHPNFREIDLQKQINELKNSKEAIMANIPDKRYITMAYPYCVPGNDSACGKYYISARGCQGFVEPKTPGSYFNVSSIGVGNQSSMNTLNDFKLKFANAAKINGWCVLLIHGIDDDGGYSPISCSELTKTLEYLSVRKSKFWVTTFLNATLYSRERDAARVTEVSKTNSTIVLEVSDTLPDSIYNYPLTIRRPMPVGWPSATVTQNGKPVTTRIVMVDSIVYITFDVVPDDGEVIISKNRTAVNPIIDTLPADNEDSTEYKAN